MLPAADLRPWTRKAEQDYRSAVALARLRADPVPDNVCFLAQQCAEKYLKAFLIHHREPFPKTHDLLELLTLALKHDGRLSVLHGTLGRLRHYAVVIRYPGAGATPARGRRALRDARQVRELIRRRLRLR